MRGKINSYLAILFIVIAGAVATTVIVHVTYANTFEVTFNGSEAEYLILKQSILEK